MISLTHQTVYWNNQETIIPSGLESGRLSTLAKNVKVPPTILSQLQNVIEFLESIWKEIIAVPLRHLTCLEIYLIESQVHAQKSNRLTCNRVERQGV